MSPQFLAPRTLEDALAALADQEAVPVAGGVALGLLTNLDLIAADRFVSLAKVPGLTGVSMAGQNLILGAATSHRELSTDPLLGRELPELAQMFGSIGNVRVRAWGTVGGNLALAEPSQDPPVFLAALGAEVAAQGPNASRRLPVAALADGPMSTVLGSGELITQVVVPRLDAAERCAYLKFLPKTADDYATVSAGVRLRLDGGRIAEARLFCGSVGPVPVDCHGAAELLVGRTATDHGVLDGVAEAVQDVVSPVADHRGSVDYKRQMAGVFARRAVSTALAAHPPMHRAAAGSEGDRA